MIENIVEHMKNQVLSIPDSEITLVPFNQYTSEDILTYLYGQDRRSGLLNDPRILETLGFEIPENPESWLENLLKSQSTVYYGVNHPIFGLVGYFGLKGIDTNDKSFLMGAVTDPNYWGQSFNKQALKIVLVNTNRLGFETAIASTLAINSRAMAQFKAPYADSKKQGEWIVHKINIKQYCEQIK